MNDLSLTRRELLAVGAASASAAAIPFATAAPVEAAVAEVIGQ